MPPPQLALSAAGIHPDFGEIAVIVISVYLMAFTIAATHKAEAVRGA